MKKTCHLIGQIHNAESITKILLFFFFKIILYSFKGINKIKMLNVYFFKIYTSEKVYIEIILQFTNLKTCYMKIIKIIVFYILCHFIIS